VSRTVVVTGGAKGIGLAVVERFAALGDEVIALGRDESALASLSTKSAVCDVTDEDAVTRTFGQIGAVDVLVNNAGFGVLGPTSEISDAEMRRQYETNVFGLMNVTRAFLPRMMERRNGRIINVSSVGGRITLPYFGVYNSTKYAVESLSEALRYELRPFGIDVVLIEPGVIRTNFEATAVSNLGSFATTPYAVAVSKYEKMSKMADRFASNPIVIAKAISRAVRARRPSARYVAPWSTNFVLWMNAVLPTRVWDWAMRKVGFLNAKSLGLTGKPAAAAPDVQIPHIPATSAKPAEARAMN
jgi:NAD(P)-dependent dehydrogenase (short-subunit alcohol dehydrogenase family)